MSPPRPPSLQLLSLNINGLRGRRKRAALFSVLLSGPCHVIALQETHHASQAEAAQWCREGAGPTAPWDGLSFWAAGTSSSRGVAFFFFFFLGGRDIHYTCATITTSRVCEVHSKPERQKLTTHLEFAQAFILKGMAMKAKQATVKPKLVTQLERHARFCPPTLHNTKLDQLNKAHEKRKASIVKAKPTLSCKASMS